MGVLNEAQVASLLQGLYEASGGSPWNAHTDPDWYYGRTVVQTGSNPAYPDGVTLHIDVRDGRAEVSGVMPSYLRPFYSSYSLKEDGYPDHITVAVERGGAVLAKEIGRRYLPAWTAYLGVLRERKARDDDWRNAIADMRAQAQAALGEAIVLEPTRNEPEYTFGRVPGMKHVRGEVYLSTPGTLYPSSIRLKLDNLPVDIALSILHFLATAAPVAAEGDGAA